MFSKLSTFYGNKFSKYKLTYFTLFSLKATGTCTDIGFNAAPLWIAWWIAVSCMWYNKSNNKYLIH